MIARPRPAHLQGVRRGAAAGAPHRARPRRGDPRRRPDAPAHRSATRCALLPARARAGINPDQVVAMGAALHAASLAAPEAGSYLLDVTPLTLRMGTVGGSPRRSSSEHARSPSITCATSRPCRTARRRSDARLPGRVEPGRKARAARRVRVRGLRARTAGEVKIEVTFEINTDGIVNVRRAIPRRAPRPRRRSRCRAACPRIRSRRSSPRTAPRTSRPTR